MLVHMPEKSAGLQGSMSVVWPTLPQASFSSFGYLMHTYSLFSTAYPIHAAAVTM